MAQIVGKVVYQRLCRSIKKEKEFKMTKCQCKESTRKHHRPGECKNPATHKDTQMCDPCHNEKVAKQMVDAQAGTNNPMPRRR